MRISDWSSDVCSSDLLAADRGGQFDRGLVRHHVRKRRVLFHHIARLHVPGDDFRLGVPFSDVGQLQFEPGHRQSRSEENTSELKSLIRIPYPDLCLINKTHLTTTTHFHYQYNHTSHLLQ